jgi:hypothetical protein
MGAWPALWDVPKPLVPVTANPQGATSAPVGTIAVDGCGNLYIKRGGGSTAYGWYLFGSAQQLDWMPNWVNGAAQLTVNRNTQSIAVGPTTIINFLPTKSGSAASNSPKRSYVGGYTSGVGGNSFLYRLTNNTDSMPTQRIDQSVAADFQEFDWYADVLTTPRSSSAAGTTDLTTNAMRIWVGGAWGTSGVQAVGGTVSSDTLYTEWPTALTATNGLFGFAFRWSSAIDGTTWKFVSANSPGGVAAQTVTDTTVTIAADTLYRLRVRYILVSGVLTAMVSVNDGTEIAVTLNVGPGATPAPNQTQPFQPLASLRQINATVKSLAIAQISLAYGTGVGVTC